MSRRPDRSSPLDNRKKALEDQAAKLKAEIERTRKFLEKAPEMKAEAQKREQQQIFTDYRRPVRVEGPVDFRCEITPENPATKPRRLRKERSKAPLVTLVLLVAFGCVAFYAVRTLWGG